jgi:G3E family GTPase
VPAGVVVLTKADLVDADTLELVQMEVRGSSPDRSSRARRCSRSRRRPGKGWMRCAALAEMNRR